MYETKPHGNKGRKHTDETRAKIAEAMRQNKNAEVHPELRIHAKRTKEPRPHALKGKPKSAEHKLKIALALRQNNNASREYRAISDALLTKEQRNKHLEDIAAQDTKQRRAHSEATKERMRLAKLGNHNALRPHIQNTQAAQAAQEPLTTADNTDDLQTLEQELLAMIKEDSKQPTYTKPLPALDNMRDFFESDAEFQEWKALQT